MTPTNTEALMSNKDPADPSTHEPRVTGAPKVIWLVYGELEHDDTHANCADSGEVTWCENAQFASDVRYLRADVLYHEARQIASRDLDAERDALRAALKRVVDAWDGGELSWFKYAYEVMDAARAAMKGTQ